MPAASMGVQKFPISKADRGAWSKDTNKAYDLNIAIGSSFPVLLREALKKASKIAKNLQMSLKQTNETDGQIH